MTSLTLTSATHSVAGNVFAAWQPTVVGAMVDGFGNFDFGVDDGVGATNPNLILAGENIVFVFTIGGTGPFVMTDFDVANASGYNAASKWVSCTGNDCVELDDSAFGASLPELGSGALLLVGLTSWLVGSRRRD